jgi:hypothetical protein
MILLFKSPARSTGRQPRQVESQPRPGSGAGASGAKSRPIEQPVGVCAQCPASDLPDTVSFVVAVDRQGRVREDRLLGSARGKYGNRQPSPEVAAAARQALQQWRFEPARAKGQVVSDWCSVRVVVRGPN